MNLLTNTLTIGLTGGIASGKTHVANLFIKLGVPLLEADEVAREVVAPPSPALAEIATSFGADMLNADGTLNRRALRDVVFADSAALKRLEAITHPAIRARVSAWRAAQTAPYCIYSAAILIEAGMAALVDRVLVVDAPEDVQLRRLTARDGANEVQARQMIATQASRSLRLGRADDVIDNRDETRSVEAQVARLHRHYTSLGSTRRSAP